MRSRPTFLVIIGTRPEAIKLAPVIRELRARKQRVQICVTGQHREMLRPHLRALGIKADFTLRAMRDEPDLSALASRLLTAVDRVLKKAQPDWVIVQGDSTSAFAGALAAYHRQIKVAHVEAGLRTYNLSAPFPEEMNRRAISLIATVHFAPTDAARANLRREGIAAAQIVVSGNTVIDSLRQTMQKMGPAKMADRVLVTAHRRENLPRLHELTAAIDQLAQTFPKTEFVLLGHKNPQVAKTFGRVRRAKISPPLEYKKFLAALASCRFVITDSGGLQEEATALGKPLLVLRNATERAEAMHAGVAELVPMKRDAIILAATRLLTDAAAYARRARPSAVFGDGKAAERIVARLLAG